MNGYKFYALMNTEKNLLAVMERALKRKILEIFLCGNHGSKTSSKIIGVKGVAGTTVEEEKVKFSRVE